MAHGANYVTSSVKVYGSSVRMIQFADKMHLIVFMAFYVSTCKGFMFAHGEVIGYILYTLVIRERMKMCSDFRDPISSVDYILIWAKSRTLWLIAINLISESTPYKQWSSRG